MRRLVVVAVIAGLAPATAQAHQASFSYGHLAISADHRRVDYELKLRTSDLYEALGLASDRDPSDAEIAAGAARLFAYVEARVALEAPGQACGLSRGDATVVDQGGRFARLTFALTCPAPIAQLTLDYDLFFDLDPRHTGLVTIGDEIVRLRLPGENRLVYDVSAPGHGGVLGFVPTGIDHILYGTDHILFLVSLLLMAAITRRPSWQVRTLGATLRYAATIVTSFTIAHSLTLVAASLGWVSLPSRVVESAIAASIVFVALENVLRPDPPRRYLITFGFGLIHGLGFASALRPLLPPDRVVAPLLAFNLGVELGQLAIVVALLPILHLVAARLGAERYRKVVLPLGGAVLTAIGSLWLIERAFGIRILGI